MCPPLGLGMALTSPESTNTGDPVTEGLGNGSGCPRLPMCPQQGPSWARSSCPLMNSASGLARSPGCTDPLCPACNMWCPLALQAAAMLMENKPMSLKLIMTLAFSTLGERAFMNRTVGEIMWGYEDPLIHLINKYLPNMFPFKGKFGLFAEVSVAQLQVRGWCLVFQ